MKALALEGGGTKGAYQIGAYEALIECGYEFDTIVGTSIGSINAASIASGDFLKLKKFWEEVDMGNLLSLSEDFVTKLNNKSVDINMLGDVLEIIKNKGIDTKNIKATLNELIDEEKLRNSATDYGLVTVKKKSYKPIQIFKKDIPEGKLIDYILASCFLPVFKREKLIDDEIYVDGGFYDVCPVSMVMNKGFEEIIAIRVKGIGLFKRKSSKTDKITYLEPSRPLGSILTLDKARIKENMLMGYYDTIRYLKKLDGYKYTFNPHSLKFYQFYSRRVPKPLYRRVKAFFNTNDEKGTTIKAIEYVMKKDKVDYNQIYDIKKIVKKIKKTHRDDDHFMIEYIRKLRII